jgi:hypothetical protein
MEEHLHLTALSDGQRWLSISGELHYAFLCLEAMAYYTLVVLVFTCIPGRVTGSAYWMTELVNQVNVGLWRVAPWDSGSG